MCDENGGFNGVHVTGTRCRVEERASANSRGISVTGMGNLIVRNSVSGNGGQHDRAQRLQPGGPERQLQPTVEY